VRFRTGTTQEYCLCRDCKQHCRSVSFVSLSCRVCIFFVCCKCVAAFAETVGNTTGLFRVFFLSLARLFRVLQPFVLQPCCSLLCCSRVAAFVETVSNTAGVSLSCRVCIFFVCCSLCRDRQQHCRCVSVVSRVYLFRVLQCVAALLVETVSSTARSVEDETRNAHQNAKRTPNRNQETTITRLFSNFQMKRDLEQ